MHSKMVLGAFGISLALFTACGQTKKETPKAQVDGLLGPSLAEKILKKNKGETLIGKNQNGGPCSVYVGDTSSRYDDPVGSASSADLIFFFSSNSAAVDTATNSYHQQTTGLPAQAFKKSDETRISYEFGPNPMQCLFSGSCPKFRLDIVVNKDLKITEIREVLASDHDQPIETCKLLEGEEVLGN